MAEECRDVPHVKPLAFMYTKEYIEFKIMISKNKEFLGLLIVLFIFIALIWLANDALGSKTLLNHTLNEQIIISGLYGLWTALFAFIFLGISTIIDRITKRKILHFNSMVTLEAQLNEMLGIIKDTLLVIDGFRNSITRGNIYWGRMKTFYIDRTHFEKLYDLSLVNELFAFYYKLRQVNDDMQNLQNGYDDLKNALIHKDITMEHYVANAVGVSDNFKLIAIFLEKAEEDLLGLLAKIRIQLRKDKPFITKLQQKFIFTSGNNITVAEFENEKKRLRKELEETSERSKKEIDLLVKNKK